MRYPVVDLHSDLLSYLIHKEGRKPDDPPSRNSFPQMQEGHVAVQTLAIFARTGPHSVEHGKKQFDHFQHLLSAYPDRCAALSTYTDLSPSRVHLIAAIENFSACASETEHLNDIFVRLDELLDILPALFYITMTWDGENRFGGGVGSTAGLKKDGEELLSRLSDKRVAIDLSHTSDRFASEIIEYIDKMSLAIPLIASHSNFRSVTNRPRNLPDAIAKEIIRRGGLIGMNFFVPFIHLTDPTALLRHIEYGLSLGGEKALCFGADFFSDQDFPVLREKYPEAPFFFFEEYKDSSTYPYILSQLQQCLELSETELHNIASGNAIRFLKENIL
jgi:membrane dipeptidase